MLLISQLVLSLPTRAFNLATCAFSVLIRGFELETRKFELGTRNSSLREKCPNTEVFLVGIFLYFPVIQENTDQKKLRIWTLSTQCVTRILLFNYFWKRKFYKCKENIKFHTKSCRWKESNKVLNDGLKYYKWSEGNDRTPKLLIKKLY